ncbi:ribosome maturation factor RimM [bacterium BMS3Abin03]|nr:ribosome maturation factor RimM [bacterium BMS3Abin03]
MSDFFLIARIVSLFGKDGYIKIEPVSDFPERFFSLSIVYIDFWGEKKEFVVEDVKQLKNAFALKLKNFDDERSSKLLRGRDIFVKEDKSFELPENNFYVHDLIGSKVYRMDEEIGVVKDLLSPPANDVLVIESKDKKEILIPFVLEFIENYDPKKKILVLKKDAGYYDED